MLLPAQDGAILIDTDTSLKNHKDTNTNHQYWHSIGLILGKGLQEVFFVLMDNKINRFISENIFQYISLLEFCYNLVLASHKYVKTNQSIQYNTDSVIHCAMFPGSGQTNHQHSIQFTLGQNTGYAFLRSNNN